MKKKEESKIEIADPQRVSDCVEIFMTILEKESVNPIDAMGALAILLIRISISLKVIKPHLLSNISGMWECMEEELNKE